MNTQSEWHPGWSVALWLGLFISICLSWSPRYWAVSFAISSISMIGVCWALSSLVQGKFINLSFQMCFVALTSVWGFFQIAAGTSVTPRLTLDSTLIWAISGVAFLLGSQVLRMERARRHFLELLMGSFTVLAVVAMLQFHLSPERAFGLFRAPDSVFGTFISRNQFAALMEITAPLALWFMVERSLMVGAICYVMVVAATITAASRAGFICICAELGIFIAILFFTRRREAKTILFALGSLALLGVLVAVLAGTMTLQQRFSESDQYIFRRELGFSTTHLITEKPWFGHGFGSWRAIYPHVATFDASAIANEAHNDWAQWTAEGGIPFFVLMGAFVVSLVIPAVRSIWGLGLLSVMAHSFVDFPLREPSLSFLWFALAGALCSSLKTESADEKRERGAARDRLRVGE